MDYIGCTIKALRALIQKTKNQQAEIKRLNAENETLSNNFAELKVQCDQYRSKTLEQEEKIAKLEKAAHNIHGYPFNI